MKIQKVCAKKEDKSVQTKITPWNAGEAKKIFLERIAKPNAPRHKNIPTDKEHIALQEKFPIKAKSSIKPIKFFKPNCFGKAISLLYQPKIGIKGDDPNVKTFLVPAPGVCYWDVLYFCDK